MGAAHTVMNVRDGRFHRLIPAMVVNVIEALSNRFLDNIAVQHRRSLLWTSRPGSRLSARLRTEQAEMLAKREAWVRFIALATLEAKSRPDESLRIGMGSVVNLPNVLHATECS